ncbi:MAG: hypothetical protein QOF24_426 [Verrucomicrobiota bacterium]|jgi:hypothetical protein
MNWTRRAKFLARDPVYPGLDLHTRNRAVLCRFWRTGNRDVLDVGSRNDYFSWLAYESGANVLALNIDSGQVQKARHVRAGYAMGDYRVLLERLGFELREYAGVGSRALYLADKVLRTIRNRVFVLPLLPIGLLVLRLASPEPPMPFSIYVKAITHAQWIVRVVRA